MKKCICVKQPVPRKSQMDKSDMIKEVFSLLKMYEFDVNDKGKSTHKVYSIDSKGSYLWGFYPDRFYRFFKVVE